MTNRKKIEEIHEYLLNEREELLQYKRAVNEVTQFFFHLDDSRKICNPSGNLNSKNDPFEVKFLFQRHLLWYYKHLTDKKHESK